MTDFSPRSFVLVVSRTFVCMWDMRLFRTLAAVAVTVLLGTHFIFTFFKHLLGDSTTPLRSTKYELFTALIFILLITAHGLHSAGHKGAMVRFSDVLVNLLSVSMNVPAEFSLLPVINNLMLALISFKILI